MPLSANVSAEGGAPNCWASKGGGLEGWEAQNFAFFPSPATIFFLPLSWRVLSWNSGGVFEGQDTQMCTFGLLGCRVKPREGRRKENWGRERKKKRERNFGRGTHENLEHTPHRHNTTQHNTTPHNTTRHNTTQHNTHSVEAARTPNESNQNQNPIIKNGVPEVKIWAKDRRYSSRLSIQWTRNREIRISLTWKHRVLRGTTRRSGRNIKTCMMYWVDTKLAQKKGFKFYQTRSNAIIVYDTLPAYCIPKAIMIGTGEIIYEKVYGSLRPPPKISFEHNWMK